MSSTFEKYLFLISVVMFRSADSFLLSTRFTKSSLKASLLFCMELLLEAISLLKRLINRKTTIDKAETISPICRL